MSPKEVVTAVRLFANTAAVQTKRPDTRTDKEILDHVKMVWHKTLAAIRGNTGEWRR